MGDIGFKRCLTSRTLQRLNGLRLLQWCGTSRDTTVPRSQKQKCQSGVTFANKMTSIFCRNFSFVAILKFTKNFSTAFEKGQRVSILAVWMVKIIEVMVSIDFQSGNTPPSYHLYIWVAKFLLQSFSKLNIFKSIYETETGSRMLGISHFDGETLSFSWTRKDFFWSVTETRTSRN